MKRSGDLILAVGVLPKGEIVAAGLNLHNLTSVIPAPWATPDPAAMVVSDIA